MSVVACGSRLYSVTALQISRNLDAVFLQRAVLLNSTNHKSPHTGRMLLHVKTA